MSNNIYNILGNLAKLTPKEETPKEQAKAIYESVEAKGSISAGVSKIEQKLAEQFKSVKEASYVHKGTYGTEYQGDADDEEEEQKKADAGKRGRGRPRKHAVKAKVAGRGRGRPAKEKKSASDGGKSLQDLLIGKAPKKPTKGTMVKGRAMSHPDNKKGEDLDEKAKNPYAIGMAQAEKMTGDKPPLKKSTIVKAHDIAKKVKANEGTSKLAQRMLSEGVNFRKMAEETGSTVDEMLEGLQADINEYKMNGSCSERLRDFIELHNHTKKQLADAVRPEDVPAFQRKQAGKDFPVTMDQVKDRSDNISSPEGLAKLKRDTGLEEELNELAKLAGLDVNEAKKPDADKDGVPDWADKKPGKDDTATDKDEEVEEGNQFSGALAKAKAAGAKEFEVDGKKYKVEESCGTMSPMGSAVADMDADNLNVNTSYNSKDGRKSITVSAEGEMAEQLAQMLKLSGLAGGKPQQQPEVQVVQLSPESAMEAKDYGDTDVEEAPEYANSPDQEVADVDAITDQGDDLNRQKKQFAGKPKAGDNPMAEEFDPIEAMGRKLMREYESIKVQK